MKDPNPLSEQNAAQEDVATLYSWANLHGAKYRDFSAARAQTREKARLRAEQAMEEALRQSQPEAATPAPEPAATEIRATEEAQTAEAPQAAEQTLHAGQIQSADALQQEPSVLEPAQAAQLQEDQFRQAEIGQDQFRQNGFQPEQIHQTQPDLAQNDQAEKAEAESDEAQHRQAELAVEQAAHEAARQAQLAAQLAAAQQAAEQAARVEAEQAARRAAEEAAELAALKAAQQARDHAAYLAEQEAAQRLVQRAAEQSAQQLSQQRTWQQQPSAVRFPSTPAAPYYPPPAPKTDYEFSARTQPYRPPASPFSTPPFAAPRPEQIPETGPAPRDFSARDQRYTPDVREPAVRPAWLSAEARPTPGPFAPPPVSPGAYTSSANGLPSSTPLPAQASYAPAPGETLQSSRDRLASRWFALRGVFDGLSPETHPAPAVSWPPTLAVFSLAGGVGKTSLVATLGRALSARGERVLLVDTAAFGLLPFFFGATDQRPGMLRVFTPPIDSSDAPIQMVTIDPDGQSADHTNPESLSGEIARFTRDAGRILIDLATASGATTRRILRMAPMVLVPVIADMNSVVSVSSIDSFFEHNTALAGKPALPYYVLNQFDATLPLHLDVREVLREQLGGRLLPFALRRASAMSEALAEGMTVMDYAPGSTLADDFNTLAGWVRTLAAPAATSDRSVRWSER